MLTEKNLLTEINCLMQTEKLGDKSVTCSLLPFSHLYGLLQGVLVPLYSGGDSIIADLDLSKMIEMVKSFEKLGITHVFTVPSVYYILAKVPGIEKYVKNVPNFFSGGNKLSLQIFENFYRRTNRKIREGYGLTESSPACTLNYQEEDPNANSIGLPMPGCDIRIFKSDKTECRAGEIGEICIKGGLVFKGYFNNQTATNNVLHDGWLHTGDFGKKDNQGLIYYCGLKKEMINVAGNNVYPKKVERLMQVPENSLKVDVYSEESVLHGHTVGARIKLKDNSLKKQEKFKRWCSENINNIILPKLWMFE